jgi:hypothetical protein
VRSGSNVRTLIPRSRLCLEIVRAAVIGVPNRRFSLGF